LYGNALNGTIPSSIGNFPELTNLYASSIDAEEAGTPV